VITAVDTSVLLDVFGADPRFGPGSKQLVRRAIDEGTLAACEAVWAELGAAFPTGDALEAAMDQLGVRFEPLPLRAALAAGEAWRSYRARGGRRERVAADFLIGAHALIAADRLLTRDRGFYRSYFAGLSILDPTAS
jgi:predicted nucleic acid-binding protein